MSHVVGWGLGLSHCRASLVAFLFVSHPLPLVGWQPQRASSPMAACPPASNWKLLCWKWMLMSCRLWCQAFLAPWQLWCCFPFSKCIRIISRTFPFWKPFLLFHPNSDALGNVSFGHQALADHVKIETVKKKKKKTVLFFSACSPDSARGVFKVAGGAGRV